MKDWCLEGPGCLKGGTFLVKDGYAWIISHAFLSSLCRTASYEYSGDNVCLEGRCCLKNGAFLVKDGCLEGPGYLKVDISCGEWICLDHFTHGKSCHCLSSSLFSIHSVDSYFSGCLAD